MTLGLFVAWGGGACATLRGYEEKERVEFVGRGPTLPASKSCEFTNESDAALSARGFVQIGSVVHRATGGGSAEDRIAEEAAQHGGELVQPRKSSGRKDVMGSAAFTTVSYSPAVGMSLGSAGGYRTVESRVTVAAVWRRGDTAPPAPRYPWLDRWKESNRGVPARCDAGDPEACEALASSVDLGSEAFRTYREKAHAARGRRCEQGRAEDCYRLALILGGRSERGRARELSDRACQLGHADGCIYWLINAKPQPSARADVLAKLDAACARREASACTALAHYLKKSEPARSRDLGEQAVALHRRACAAGDPEPCRAPYEWFRRDDPARAESLLTEASAELERACRGGSGPACVRLGFIHSYDTRDRGAAGSAWALACQAQEIQGCVEEARTADDSASMEMLVEACGAGYGAACGGAEDRLLRGR